jgi:hypothetical protein
VLKRGETVALVEKGRRALGSFSSRGGGKKGEEWGLQPWGATRRGGGVGPGPDRRAAPRPRSDRLRTGCGAHERRVSVSDRGVPRQPGPGGSGSERERRGASGTRARVGRPEKKIKGWSSPDEQYGFIFI